MARKKNTPRPAKRKGHQSTVKLTIRGNDVWRTAYYAFVPEPIQHGRKGALKRVRRWVTRDFAAESAIDGYALATEYEQFRADWEREDVVWEGGPFLSFEEWRAHSKRVLTPEEIDRQAHQFVATTCIHHMGDDCSMTAIDAALGMMAVGKRYDGEGKFRNAKESYKRRQENYLRHIESSGFTELPMAQIHLQQLLLWWQKWCGCHAGGTAFRFRAWLVMLGSYARKARYWGENLFEALPEPRKTVHLLPQRVWTFGEMDALWAACNHAQDQALLVLLRAGLRQCEAIAIRERDCNFEANTITIRFSIGRRNVGTWKAGENKLDPYLDVPKSECSRATIKMPERWMDILKKSLEHAVPCDIPCIFPEEGVQQRYVVSNVFGEYLTDTAATKLMRRLVGRSKVEAKKGESTFHAWRYSLAADLVALGANDIELMKLMRHSDPEISKTTYASARADKSVYRVFKDVIRTVDDYLEAIATLDECRHPGVHEKRSWPGGAEFDPSELIQALIGNLESMDVRLVVHCLSKYARPSAEQIKALTAGITETADNISDKDIFGIG